MKLIKKGLSLLLSAVFVFLMCACSDNRTSAIIYYGVAEPPKTIDPQLASTSFEFMVVRNIFEGLLRENDAGELVNGVITEYKKQGLTYVFTLKDNLTWSDGTALTANDFVFAFRRALSPVTQAPHAECLFSIKNAEKIHSGSMNPENLGVRAENDNTLIIELNYDDENFLFTLTTAICMPCNEKFFNDSTGKYGMSYETVLSNGTYKLTKWKTEEFAMRIARNGKYSGSFTAKNAAVYFSKSKDYTNIKCLEKNYVDIAEIGAEDVETARKNNLSVKAINNRVIILSVGSDFSENIRKALFMSAVSSEDFDGVGYGCRIADNVFPEILSVNNIEKYSLFGREEAEQLYKSEVKRLKLEKFPQNTIEYFGDESATEIVKTVAGHWQQYLGIYINISKQENSDTVKYNIKNKSDHIAVYSVDVNQNDISQYLDNFGVSGNKSPAQAQNEIISSYSNIPLAFCCTYYASSGSLSNIKYFGTNGIIDFSYIVKEH